MTSTSLEITKTGPEETIKTHLDWFIIDILSVGSYFIFWRIDRLIYTPIRKRGDRSEMIFFSSWILLNSYLTIRLRARVFYEQIVNEGQTEDRRPSWLSLVENEGEKKCQVMRGKELFYYVTWGSNVTRDVHWCITVFYLTISINLP